MELSIDHERLKGRKLFVGTPMYGGQCHVDYAFAIARLATLCAQLGISLRFHFLCNESLVMRARNATVDAFLRSGDTHLMFIDADMGFDPRDVLHMLAMQDVDAARDDHDVIAAPYPFKKFAWDNIAKAVRSGAADADPRNLEKYAGRLVFNPLPAGTAPIDRPVEASMAGTGFMMVRRATFERYREAYPAQAFHNDPMAVAEGGPAELFAYFDTGIDSKAANAAEEMKLFLEARPDATRDDIVAFLADPASSMRRYTGQFVSEDYMFCHRARTAGMKIWLCPWMQLTHTGSYTFSTSLPHVATL